MNNAVNIEVNSIPRGRLRSGQNCSVVREKNGGSEEEEGWRQENERWRLGQEVFRFRPRE
jgi:hypothetical protein